MHTQPSNGETVTLKEVFILIHWPFHSKDLISNSPHSLPILLMLKGLSF